MALFWRMSWRKQPEFPEWSVPWLMPPPGRGKFFRDLAPGVRRFAQEGRDLGERLVRAFAWGSGAGFQNVLVRGSDTPDLPGGILLQARRRLASGQAQVVLGPSRDGGYYLVGLRDPQPQLFAGITWSSGRGSGRDPEPGPGTLPERPPSAVLAGYR